MKSTLPDVEYRPVTAGRWADLEALFGRHGACSGCWCMWWRFSRKEFNSTDGEQRRAALKALVESGSPQGILAYAGEQPIAWVSVAPRETYAALMRSRVLQPVDDRPVWSIVCFFVARPYRRSGLMDSLILAAVRYAGEQGVQIVEAYPTAYSGAPLSGSSGYMGSAAAFLRAGFTEVARRSDTRFIMRRSTDAST